MEKGNNKVFEGVKVADFAWILAGPLVSRGLAAYGATVVRIESSLNPDGLRTSTPYKDGIPGINRSGQFAFRNPNKYSMTINLNHPKGMEVAKRLIAWSDIVSENFTPGRMEQWGLGYEDIKKIKPDIIMIRSSINGQTGPWTNRRGYGILAASEGGYSGITGWSDRWPCPHYFGYGDLVAPRFCLTAVAAALLYRRRTGKGLCIDQAQTEAQLTFMVPAILDYTTNGRKATRIGNACDYAAPHAAYRCQGDDRWCVIGVFSDEQWEAFCKVLDNTDWIKDPRFATLLSRKKNEDDLNRLVEAWTISHTAVEVMNLMQEARVPAGITQSNKEVLEDPQLNSRNHVWWLEHPEIGPIPHMGSSFVLSRTPAQSRMPAPCLGEHTEYVCREFLKMPDEEFLSLLQEGALK